MARPLDRLVEMTIVRRDVPFGESEKRSRRALYRIADPFFRLWFRVVAPHRGLLASSSRATRLELLRQSWSHVVAEAWEELCRHSVPRTDGLLGHDWGPCGRWWRRTEPEWDLVARSARGRSLLLGEAKWGAGWSDAQIRSAAGRLASRPAPPIPGLLGVESEIRALFVPDLKGRLDRQVEVEGQVVAIVTAADLLAVDER
jgi:hypothetical protein